MDEATALLMRRVEALERHQREDAATASTKLHALRNDVTKRCDEVEKDAHERFLPLERAVSGSGANAQVAWMKWALGGAGVIIMFLLGKLFS